MVWMNLFYFGIDRNSSVCFFGSNDRHRKKDGYFRGKCARGDNCGRWRDHAGYHTRIDAAGGVFASGLCSCGGADIDDSFCDRICETDGFESRVKTDYYDKLMFWCDTAGLGIFTVVGIQAAVRAVGGENVFFFVFIGTLTGVGGGVLRDIMAGETPYILVKHIYACAAIAGGIVCVVGRTAFGEAYGTILGLAATVLLRFLAAHFRWNLMRVS